MIKYLFSVNTLLVIVVLFTSCIRFNEFPQGKKIVCDAESRTADGSKFIALGDPDLHFISGSQQSDMQAYTGAHSVLTIPKIKMYGMTYAINGVGSDQFFKVSVWRKSKDGNGLLVVAASNPELLYLKTKVAIDSANTGWEKLEINLRTPPTFENEKLSFYVWNNGSDSVFFDDLTIERLYKPEYPEYNEKPIVIELDTTAYSKIYKKRKIAFENGILESADNDWVKGFMFQNNDLVKIKLRLKGDWLDHLYGDKWSYRIKMKSGAAWNRLRTFSIQTPEARNYLMEWMAHQLYQKNDILTTRYGFAPVIINRESKGLFAWEEHFEKQLLESRNRREGPIVKFSEDAFWQLQKLFARDKIWMQIPFFETANVLPFGEKAILENPSLKNQFLNAQKLMMQYKAQTNSPNNIFDLDKLAAYYAMLDVTHARHGMAWHNQRFYYNPVISKLEPISFDGYTTHEDPDVSINDNLAYTIIHSKEIKPEEYLYYSLFSDSLFANKYLDYLEKFSDEKTIEKQLLSLSVEATLYDSLLRLEFPYYHYDSNFFRKSAQSIRDYLPQVKKELISYVESSHWMVPPDISYAADSNLRFLSPETFVHAYTETVDSDSIVISVHNFFPDKLLFLGTSELSGFIYNYFPNSFACDAYHQGMDGIVVNFKVDTLANYLFFKSESNPEVFRIPIYRWPYPNGLTPRQELFNRVDLEVSPYIEKIVGNEVFIKKDSLLIDRPLLIPEGYHVVFHAGTVMNFVNCAMFISCSPISMNGTIDAPIVITSSDSSANGFTVLQAGEKSFINNTRFENLNTLNYKGWTLTGAVTFYESDVDIVHTEILNNHCEDALNIVRSSFVVDQCHFTHVYADAFDSDFSQGQVINTDFIQIGNDAIDFSGSQILIRQVNISQANDKGVSGGENSQLTLEDVTITNCNIGIASKDLSMVEVINSNIIHCNYGLVLLQKKPEYGPAGMMLKNTKISDSELNMLIEIGSTVIFDGKLISGDASEVSKMFY